MGKSDIGLGRGQGYKVKRETCTGRRDYIGLGLILLGRKC